MEAHVSQRDQTYTLVPVLTGLWEPCVRLTPILVPLCLVNMEVRNKVVASFVKLTY